jgi:tetratricopeptide (TPR) repeat protein
MQARAVCFIIMPFGEKPDASGHIINFDAVFREVIAPAVEAAGLAGVRADEEMSTGIIHKLMYERLLFSEYAVADLTIMNANVYYELGVRHALKPASTVLLMADGSRLPFDLGPIRAMGYALDAKGKPKDAAASRAAIRDALEHCRKYAGTDSPLYQLLENHLPPPIDHSKTDVFREQVAIVREIKEKLRVARGQGVAAIDAVRDDLGDISATEASVTVDLMLSYRAIEQWQRMVDLYGKMDPALARTVLVREQCAFALNRLRRGDEAERMLKDLIKQRGPSSETYGLLGRVYKDRWQAAAKAGATLEADGCLRQAIATYRAGFETDWRDAFPGVNAVTLMTVQNPANPEIAKLAPVVLYAAERRVAVREGDYWDHATILEMSVVGNDWDRARIALGDAVAALRETWEAQSTADNLAMIVTARREAKEDTTRIEGVIKELMSAKQRLEAKRAPSATSA